MKRKSFILKTILPFLFIFLSFGSFARVYYLSSSYAGVISNGSLSTPWKSLSDVQSNQNNFLPGDTISFKKGDVFSGTLTINKSGILSNPIVYNSYGIGAKPKFTGTGSAISYLFYLYNKNFIVFDGFEITDPSISLTDRSIQSKIQRAFGFDGTSNNNTIKNCTISLVGIGTYWVGPNNTIDHCDIGNLRMVVNNVGGDNDYGANPIVISSANNKITNNYFHDCWANSFDYIYDGGAIEFYGNGSSNNFIAYNTFYDCNGVVENGSGNGGVIENNEFSYNKFINNGSLFYISNGGTYVVTVSNMKFYNNVIIENVVDRLAEVSMGSMKSNVSTQGIVVFKNNIFELSNGVDVVRSGQWTSGQLIHENNVFKLSNNSITNFNINSNELLTSQSLWTNTTNINPTLWDFTPSNTSQVIDFGQNVGMALDILGNAIVNLPDAGVIEKQISNPATPSTLIIGLNNTDILCNGGSSLVTVSANGGTAPYIGTGTFSVSAGTYNYTITDANGVSKTSSITISQPSLLNLSLSSGSISSFGGSTSIIANVSGGAGTYLYQINNGAYQSSNTFNNVIAGNYTINVKDKNGCTKSSAIMITQPTLLSINVVANTIGCYGDSSLVTVSATGGMPPYIGTGTFVVSAGTYNYTITDANGVSKTSTITISQPSLLNLSITAGGINSFGGSTSIIANVTGGAGTYLYQINNGAYQSSNTFNNVIAGNYTINVKDKNGCTKSSAIMITQPTLLSINVVANTIGCYGDSSLVTVSATGGTPPYIGTGTFSVSAGTYNYVVADSIGNSISSTITIQQPNPIVISIILDTIVSSGGTATITINAIGGAGSYTYALNNNIYQTTNIFNNIIAGNYLLTVRDINGCIKTQTITINQPKVEILTLHLVSKKNISCRRASDGYIEVQAIGGIAPYGYSISNRAYSSNNKFYNLKPGTYLLKVKDANNNLAQISVVIFSSKQRCWNTSGYKRMSANMNSVDLNNDNDLSLKVFPNPSTTSFKLIIESGSQENIVITVIDLAGKKIFQSTEKVNKIIEFGNNFKPGVYFVRINQEDMVKTIKVVKI